MSRLPSDAASRNMSACRAQAMSQVGCRLMVASSANTSRPLAPVRCGDIARALATKAAISSDVDVLASGNGPALCWSVGFAATSPADFGLFGSPAMRARHIQRAQCGLEFGKGQSGRVMLGRLTPRRRSVRRRRRFLLGLLDLRGFLLGHIKRDRARIE